MSADRWSKCPRCAVVAREAKAAREEAARAAYGVAPVEEFDRLRAEADAPLKIEDTVREDYEFYGFEEGAVVAVYEASCKACGLSVKFRYEHPIEEARDAR